MPRWLKILLSLTFGLIVGLLYGWVIAPVQYTDSAPNTLAPQYRAEYILMVAESYQNENDLNLAQNRLAKLGSAPAKEIIQETLNTHTDYTQEEKETIEKLLSEIEKGAPTSAESRP